MAQRRLREEEIVTIRVLKERGTPQREIARRLGVTEGAVRYQLRRDAEGRDDGRRLRPLSEEELLPSIEVWWEAAKKRAGTRPPNVRHLHEHLVGAVGYDADEAAYRRLLRVVRRHFPQPAVRTYRRVEVPPGSQCQTDWGEFPGYVLGGERVDLHAFVMALSHSRMTAVIWSRRENQVAWLRCHNEAFKRLGGVPAVNRIDNVKTALMRGAGPTAEVHPVFASYARQLRFHVDPCQVRQPNAKGKTEAKVRLTRLLEGALKGPFDSLEALQEATDEAILAWSKTAVCPATGTTVFDAWQSEKAYLTPLPATIPEPFDVTVSRPVHKDCMVNFEGRQYSVPFQCVGRQVEVRGCAEVVQFLLDGLIVREWPRHTQERILIDPACYEGEATARVAPPLPLGRLGRRLQEILEMSVEERPIDLYAALAEVAG